MITDQEIIKEARSWMRPPTPWKHGIALKGWGADCIQFIVAMAKGFGWLPPEFETKKYNQDYALHNDLSVLKRDIAEFCTQVSVEELKVGDVLLFVYGRCANHAGMYLGNGRLIHCHIRHGVTEIDLKTVMDKFDSAWRFNV